MRDLDQTDLEILRMLVEDGRRPYSEIAEEVGLSPPAISDRVERLREQDIIKGFTTHIDRSKLQYTVPAVLTLQPHPSDIESVSSALSGVDRIEQQFRLSDGSLIVHVNAPQRDILSWLEEHIDLSSIQSYDLAHIEDHTWDPTMSATDFAVYCAVCENRVREDGITTQFDGEIKAFCCPSCHARYEEQYEMLSEDF